LTVTSEGPEIVGASVSLTVKLVLQVAELPEASATVMLTGVTPVPARVPAAGDWVITNDDEAVQLSVALMLAVKSGTVAWQSALAKADCAAAQLTITGAELSVTVKLVLQVAELPEASATVMVTELTPVPAVPASDGVTREMSMVIG
jgi:hypothetical protein